MKVVQLVRVLVILLFTVKWSVFLFIHAGIPNFMCFHVNALGLCICCHLKIKPFHCNPCD
uniref:Uncharacterized protein n=1 Tax=Rhizophora mucronata TaxID=61149 RepID=A0A2P2PQP2_RHIMU